MTELKVKHQEEKTKGLFSTPIPCFHEISCPPRIPLLGVVHVNSVYASNAAYAQVRHDFVDCVVIFSVIVERASQQLAHTWFTSSRAAHLFHIYVDAGLVHPV
jgi:hypothetical protein